MIIEIEKELYQEYERFDIYKTYFVTKDKLGNVIEKRERWLETVQKRPKFKPKTLVDQIRDSMGLE